MEVDQVANNAVSAETNVAQASAAVQMQADQNPEPQKKGGFMSGLKSMFSFGGSKQPQA